MRIGVVSDTHNNRESLQRAVSAVGKADAWFHLGDGANDILQIESKLGVPVYAVRGNCDLYSSLPIQRVVDLEGKRFFLTHGHEYAVNFSTELLMRTAADEMCDMAVYGHTHIPDIQYSKVYIMNPGSASRPLGGTAASCGVITIKGGEIHMEIVNI